MTKVVLVPDCGPGVGLGHLERALALAEALQSRTDSVLVLPEDRRLVDRVTRRGRNAHVMGGSIADRAEAAVEELRADVVVLDGYRFGLELQAWLRRSASVVVVDDLGGTACCDLAVNPAPGGERIQPGGADAFLGGADYALIARAYQVARQQRSPRPGEVLVSSGAVDSGGLTEKVVGPLLERCPVGVSVRAVIGPDASGPHLPEDPRLEQVEAPQDLSGLLVSAAVYAGAAGTTAVQAACVGVPMVIVPTVQNQQAQARALADAGCAVIAEASEVAQYVADLLGDSQKQTAMGYSGRVLVDGCGAKRVADAVLCLARAEAQA